MDKKLYYTTKDGQPRHVVEVTSEETEGKVQVRALGLHPSVAGAAKKGRRPSFKEAVNLADLTPLETEHCDKFASVEAELVAAPAEESTSN